MPTAATKALQSQSFKNFTVSFPSERIVVVTINRPEKLNCINKPTSREIAKIWEHLDQDEELWIGIITGNGRAFCTGADLAAHDVTEWNQMVKNGIVNDMTAPGLAGLPRRDGKKPIIAAVNGITMGGGFEMVANCDLIVAASSATFALPEAKRGIVPVAGALPRLARTFGLQRTMDLVLTGRTVAAQTLHEWGLVNYIVDSAEEVLPAAVKLAEDICKNSPDAMIVGRRGIRMAWEAGGVEEKVSELDQEWYTRLCQGENFAEGIRAFAEKRAPKWVNSKL